MTTRSKLAEIETTHGHGGRRPGSGRKPIFGVPASKLSASVPPRLRALIEKHAGRNGSLSSGLLALIENDFALEEVRDIVQEFEAKPFRKRRSKNLSVSVPITMRQLVRDVMEERPEINSLSKALCYLLTDDSGIDRLRSCIWSVSVHK